MAHDLDGLGRLFYTVEHNVNIYVMVQEDLPRPTRCHFGCLMHNLIRIHSVFLLA